MRTICLALRSWSASTKTKGRLGIVLSIWVLSLLIAAMLLPPAATGQSPSQSTPPQPSPLLTPPGAPPVEPGWVPRPIRDSKSLQVIQASITALGGATAIGAVQSCVIQGSVQAAANTTNQSGTMTWEISGAESKSTFAGSQGTYVQDSGNGQAYTAVNGTSQSLP